MNEKKEAQKIMRNNENLNNYTTNNNNNNRGDSIIPEHQRSRKNWFRYTIGL